jgi:hypothetical protein
MNLQPSNVLNLLQKSIAKKIEDNVPQTTPLLTEVKRNSGVTPMANNTFYVTEWVGNFSNIGQFQAGAVLTGGNAENIQLSVAAKRLYADVSVDEFTTEAMSKVPEGSLIDFVKGFTDRMELGIGREMNRTFHGDSTGIVARANGSSAGGTSITVQALDADTSDLDPTQYIEVNDYIKIGSSAIVQVTAITGNVLTIASRAWSDEDAIVKASSDAVTAEMSGLKNLIVATGTVQGVNVANYKNMQAYVDATSHDISATGEAGMQLAYLKTVGHKVSGKLVGYCNVTVFNAWAAYLTAYKHTAKTDENIFGGANIQGDQAQMAMPYLVFMGGKVYLDIDCWTNHWYNTDPESMTIGDMGGGVKFSVAPDGKGVWTRKSGYVPEYEATLRFYGNLIVKNPKANSVSSNVVA